MGLINVAAKADKTVLSGRRGRRIKFVLHKAARAFQCLREYPEEIVAAVLIPIAATGCQIKEKYAASPDFPDVRPALPTASNASAVSVQPDKAVSVANNA